jgi:two-component system response regulator
MSEATGGADATTSAGRSGEHLNSGGFPITPGLPAAAGLPPGPQPVEVLLVEDDAGDELMTREAFEDNRIGNRLHVVRDGREALDYLYRLGGYADAPRPGLVLLDLNLPRVDGRQVLEKIKADPDLADIPVVVLTTSSAEEDILRSYNLHANAYVTKPVDLDRFVAAIRTIDDFFVTVVKLPRRA